MESLTVRSTSDPSAGLAAGEQFLLTAAECNSIILSALAERVIRGQDGRYWWACRGDDVVGFAMQSPGGFRAVVAPAGLDAVQALVDVVAEEAPALPGFMSEATTAAAFAGRWAEVRRAPVLPVEAQRLHRIFAVRHPDGVPGTLRRAVPANRPVLIVWTNAFLGGTDSNPFDPAQLVDRHLASGRLWLWAVDGEPVSMAGLSATAGGVARIGYVYTPPEHRRHGYAAACVAALSGRVLGEGAGCILHTQLHNPTSNAVYRRIGYVPRAEMLIYRFG